MTRRIVCCLLLFLTIYAQAQNADEILLLEVTVNDHPTQAVSQFIRRAGKILATAEDLKTAGIKLSNAGDQLVDLSAIAKDLQIDIAAQKISIRVDPALLNTTELLLPSSPSTSNQVPLTDASAGALLNYDLLATSSGPTRVLSGLAEARFYKGPHVFSNTVLGYVGGEVSPPVRLDTTYTYSDPDRLRRYSLGDFISNGLSWTRPVRMAGVQLSTDFSLRPDLVTFPTPNLRGEAVVSSNVDLFLNGIRQLSEPVPPGPFEIRQAPIATGAGTMAIAVTDALGRQTFKTIPFYASDRLLADGLLSYSLETGTIRKNYGLASNDYGTAVASSSVRYGLRPTLTLEGHAEATKGLLQAGLGMVTTVQNWGLISASVAGSSSDSSEVSSINLEHFPDATDQITGRRSGLQYSFGFERRAATTSFSISKVQVDKHYRDIGAMAGSPVARSILTAGGSVYSQQYGSVNLAYTAVKAAATPFGTSNSNAMNTPGAEVVSLSYFKSILSRANFFLTTFRNISDHSYGVTMGLVISLGPKDAVSGTAQSSGGLRSSTLQASRPTVLPGDFGWQLQSTQGDFIQRLAELDYKGSAGRASIAVSQSGNLASERAGIRGSVAWADHSLFLSNWIDDSFAVINTSGIKDVAIYAENRMAGRTDANGKLLISDLRSYEPNKISMDLTDLPLDIQVETSEAIVKPHNRGGVVVAFKLAQTLGARVILKGRDGKFLPLGTLVTIKETGAKSIVGYDGETYFPELKSTNNLDVTTPTGEHCQLSADFVPQKESIPVLGPLTCQ